MEHRDTKTRTRILRSALKIFADCGYAAASVQAIVDAAQVTKPTLYYYFGSKAGLFQALIDWAHDERFRLMEEALARSGSLRGQLVEILAALFEFCTRQRSLMRIAFATAFAAPGEIPREISYLAKGERNFELVHGLIRKGLAEGALKGSFDSRELAQGIYGLMTIRVMAHLVRLEEPLTRRDAESIVALFLGGAAAERAGGRGL